MDIQREREAFDEWHYKQYLLENPNIDISNAKYIYDYAHKNVLVFQLKESHFTAWQAAIARMEVRINTLDEMLLNQGEALAQAKAQAVPEGFVLMPMVPSERMINAVRQCYEGEAYLPYSLYSEFVNQAIIERMEAQEPANAL